MFILSLIACGILVSIAFIMIKEYKNPAKTIAWTIMQFIFPLFGFLFYLFVGNSYPHSRTYRRKTKRYCFHHPLPTIAYQRELHLYPKREATLSPNPNLNPRMSRFLQQFPRQTLTHNHEVRIFSRSSKCFTRILREIESAEKYIFFQFYTIRHDQIGKKFQEALIRKAKQGLEVRVIYDTVGSFPLSAKFIRKMKQAGVEIHAFLPVWSRVFFKRMNYRNHRKVVVIDGRVGFIGGMNIGDEYLGANRALGFWRDTHLQIAGEAVLQLHMIFMQDWFICTGHKLNPQQIDKNRKMEGIAVQVVESGPDIHEDTIHELFFTAFTTASESIYISTPYFIPDPSIRMALQTAAMSGIDVKLILPDKMDSRLVRFASHAFLEEMISAGVQVYFYQRGFMHAKVMLIDQKFATVGSANMDWRSFYHNFEVLAILYDNKHYQRLYRDFWQDLKDSKQVNGFDFQSRPWYIKKLEILARLWAPFL